MATTCVVIGCYRLPQFVELCVRRVDAIFGGNTPILLSDDKSPCSRQIYDLADLYCLDYTCSESRRSHFSGDMQTFLNGLAFCQKLKCDVMLKLSQRFIIVLPEFRDAMTNALEDPNIDVILPGQMRAVARREARFYQKFGILTDVLAIRGNAITPEELLDTYRSRCGPRNKASDSFAETTWGYLLATKFANRHRIIPEWTNHQPFKPKLYLRKSQSTEMEYKHVAKMEGMANRSWDLREWGQIEGREYKGRPDVV